MNRTEKLQLFRPIHGADLVWRIYFNPSMVGRW